MKSHFSPYLSAVQRWLTWPVSSLQPPAAAPTPGPHPACSAALKGYIQNRETLFPKHRHFTFFWAAGKLRRPKLASSCPLNFTELGIDSAGSSQDERWLAPFWYQVPSTCVHCLVPGGDVYIFLPPDFQAVIQGVN